MSHNYFVMSAFGALFITCKRSQVICSLEM
jgi:hypothetical protein